MAAGKVFDRSALAQAFHELGRKAFEEGKTIEIAVYGGSALVLTYAWRTATRDVDAVFEAHKETVRRLASAIAEEHGWDRDWLNDGVEGFLSAVEEDAQAKRLLGTYPSEEEPGLRVMVAKPEYLFAMKCRAMRLGGVEESADVEDIRKLASEIGIKSADEALELVAAFYPRQVIEPKTQFGLEEIFGALAGGENSSPNSGKAKP